MENKLGVVVVDYKSMERTCDYIKKFCEKVRDFENALFVVVDNSDSEENYHYLWNEFTYLEECETYRTEYAEAVAANKFLYKGCAIYALRAAGNIGYARGNNLGIEYIKRVEKIDTQYLLISNNDIMFLEDLLIEDLLKPFKTDKNIAVVGPKILEKAGGSPQSPRNKMSIWKLLVLYNINLIFGNQLKKYVDDIDREPENGKYYWVMGCFLLIETKKFFEAGMFDNGTFLYSEEMILSERLEKIGYYMYYCDDIVVLHNHGKTINKHVSSNNNVKYLYQSHRLCCQKYRNATKTQLLIADIVFEVYKVQYIVKQKVKGLLRGR